MKPFVQETKDSPDDVETELDSSHPPLTATFGLLMVALMGLTFQIIAVFFPIRQIAAIYPSIAWVRIVPDSDRT